MKIGFIYPSTESLGIEYLSSSLKNNNHETVLVLGPCLFSDNISNNALLGRLFLEKM